MAVNESVQERQLTLELSSSGHDPEWRTCGSPPRHQAPEPDGRLLGRGLGLKRRHDILGNDTTKTFTLEVK
jgi:hypothetical protein